ncbi:MAG: outer membrane protein transport protein, partial [Verrucomicrobia bacterium]|nr:outer membrane protein transport protein [Verrucomicrobiota bacterium]
WLILNPAGLTDVDMSVDASFQVFAPVRTADMGGERKDNSAFVIPSISTSFGCCHGENGSLGLGIYGTSGMGVDYDPALPMGSMTELSVAKMTATYAYKFGDSGLSIGAGPIFVLSQFKTDMMGTSGDWDLAYGAGVIIGINQHIGRLTIGGSYISEQFMSDFDEYSSIMPNSLNLPQQLTVGAAYNVLDNLELALDYRWTGWSGLETMGDQFLWDDQNIVKAGVTWGVSDALTLRGGISYGESPIDEDGVMNNALFPAIMETHLACGASYAWEKWAAHLAYIHALENEITATGGGATISMYQNSLTAGVTYKF